MRLLILSGIFPPDIGGPATHASDLADEMRARGHDVTVLTLTDGPATESDPGLVRFPRRWPFAVRTAVGVLWLVRRRRRYDVIYATGLHEMAAAASLLARYPLVVKVVSDHAWEWGQRNSLTTDDFDAFQAPGAVPLRVRAVRGLRNWSLRSADVVTTPGEHLRASVERWAGPDRKVLVVPNGVRVGDPGVSDAEPAPWDTSPDPGRNASALSLVAVGRLIPLKRLDLLVEAVARTPDVHLDILGDGPEQERLDALVARHQVGGRVILHGAVAHAEVLRRLGAADAIVHASSHEGVPHVLIEALASGTPVVAAVGAGVGEALGDGLGSLLVDPPTVEAFATTLSRLRDEPGLRRRLAADAATAGEGWRFGPTADRIEHLLQGLAKTRPRVVFVGKMTYRPPLADDVLRKMAFHSRHLRQTSVGLGRPGVRTIEGVRLVLIPALPQPLGAMLFYSVGPVLAVLAAAGRRRRAIVCQSPFEGIGVILASRLLPRSIRPLVQVEVHGDWRTASRLYGSRVRRLASPFVDPACRWALRGADQVRTLSTFLEGRVRETGYAGPVERYLTFSDYAAFLDPPLVPLPVEPVATFVGALERYKGVEVLLKAWPEVLTRLPGAKLEVIGAGSRDRDLRRQAGALGLDRSVVFVAPMSRPLLAARLDRCTCLVLPSRLEGLGRVVLEAMARARPVVASSDGGIVDLVEDGVTGRLVPVGDARALADALVDVLADRERADLMGQAGRRAAEKRDPAAEYESGIVRLASWIGSRS